MCKSIDEFHQILKRNPHFLQHFCPSEVEEGIRTPEYHRFGILF